MCTLFAQIKSKAGFSLSELVVTMGVMGIVSLGVGTLMVQQSRQTASLKKINEVNEIAMQIAGYIKNPEVCGDILKMHFARHGKDPGASHPNNTTYEINFSNVAIAGKPGSAMVTNDFLKSSTADLKQLPGLRITELQLSTQKISSVGGQSKMRATLTLKFDSPSVPVGGQFATRTFAFTYLTKSDGSYICNKDSFEINDLEKMCDEMGGTWANNKCDFCNTIGGYLYTPDDCRFD